MTRIDTPYDPDSVDGEFGWLWMGTDIDGDDCEWQLVFTELPDGIDAEPQLRAIAADLGADADHLHHAADYAGRPYLPASPPAAEPGAALLVEMRLAGGATLSACWMEDNADCHASFAAVRDVMTRRAPDATRTALADCRDRLAEHLRDWLDSECPCHPDGTPKLQALLPSVRAIMTGDVRALQAAEAAIGRGDIPAWLADALDTWPSEDHA